MTSRKSRREAGRCPDRGDGGRGSQPPAGGAGGPQGAACSDQEDKFLRLAAEYDNYRRRQPEGEGIRLERTPRRTPLLAFLPVYDNLERALKQETADEAYKKGVEMTMTQLKDGARQSWASTEIPALGRALRSQPPQRRDARGGRGRWREHRCAMCSRPASSSGDKVVRFAMVKVAN